MPEFCGWTKRLFREHREQREGLKNPDHDPSFATSETSEVLLNSDLGEAMRQPIYPHDFHHPRMAPTSGSGGDENCNWPPPSYFCSQQNSDPDDTVFNRYIDFGDDQPAESAPPIAQPMVAGPSQSSQSSHSSSSSSKRRKSNGGSARSSFSLADGAGMPATHYSVPGVSLPTGAYRQFEVGSPNNNNNMDAINQMASLAVTSTNNSSPDSKDSNQATGQTIPGMAIPYATSPDMKAEPSATAESAYFEPVWGSAEFAAANLNWHQPTVPGQFLANNNNDNDNNNNVTMSNDRGLMMSPPQPYVPTRQSDISRWYNPSDQCRLNPPPPLTNQRQNYQKLFVLSEDSNLSNSPFVVMSSRTGTRVETALDIRLIIKDPPGGAKKIRLGDEHLTKLKYLKDRDVPLSPDVLELCATVFCASAMTSPHGVKTAMERAASRGRPTCSRGTNGKASLPNGNSEYRPLEGTPVRICEGCVSREVKRLRRSKPKTEETEEWLHDASHRTLVFNNPQYVEWKSPSSSSAAEQLLSQPTPRITDDDKEEDGRKKTSRKLPLPPIEPGTIAVDLAMRICCYCRHQHESTGFRVVFTLTNHRGQIFGQQVTNPIMITDDHKDKDKKDSAPSSPRQGTGSTQLNGNFTFQNGPAAAHFSPGIQQSYSVPNLAAMAGGHALLMPENLPPRRGVMAFPQPGIPNNTDMPHGTSGALTPQPTRSRQASPTGASGPQAKKRKASGSGRMLEQLRMTPIDQAQSFNSGPHGVAAARRAQAPSQRPNRLSHPNGVAGYRTNPPSPLSGDFRMLTDANRSQSMENFVSATFSIATSTRPSRQPSPPSFTQGGSMSHQADLVQPVDYQMQDIPATDAFGQPRPTSQPAPQDALPQQQLPGQGVSTFYPSPSLLPTVNTFLPSSGPLGGGEACVFIGHHFHSQLQVFFDSCPATIVEIRKELIHCIVPPGKRPGKVTVRVMHTNPPGSMVPNELTFTYEYKVENSRNQGQSQLVPIQDGTTMPNQPGNYPNGMQQWPTGNGMGHYQQQYPQQQYPQQQYSFSHQRYASESDLGYHHGKGKGFTETPPSYSDVLAEDDQRNLDMKTKSMLLKVEDALMGQKAKETFDVPATTVKTTDVQKPSRKTSHRMEPITIGRRPLGEEQTAKLREERRSKVKGLKSDRRLWAVW
ncbi:MAG: hypothetical protein Q9191_007826, partial [Dirinaria sp. TL-2023a]